MNLKEQLAAKRVAEEAVKNEGALPKVVAPEERAEPKAEEAKKPEAKKEEKQEGPQFRKGSFAYQFKYSGGTIKANKAGIYTPQNEEEFEILKHQVLRGNILFN